MKNIITILLILVTLTTYSQVPVKVTGSGGSSTDTTALSDRINAKLNIADTNLMIQPYYNKINVHTDSIVSIHAQIVGLSSTVATSTSNIDLKLNKTDTAAMMGGHATVINRNTDSVTSIHSQIVGLSSTVATNTAGILTKWDVTGNTVTAGSQFLGSTNNVSLRMRTNNVERLVIDSLGTTSYKGSSLTDFPTFSAEFLPTSGITSTGWTGTDFAAGLTHNTGNTTAASQSTAAVNATKYKIDYTITTRTAGTVTISFGSASSGAVSATGSYSPTTTSTANLTVTPTTDFDGTVVISIKSLTAVSTPIINYYNSAGTVINEIRTGVLPSTIFIGLKAGQYNTTGYQVVALGDSALMNNTSGFGNVAIGFAAMRTNTTGQSNVAIGSNALPVNTTGSNNFALGLQSLNSNTSGTGNIAIGTNSGLANTTAANNTFVGDNSGRGWTTGGTNVAIGASAGYAGGSQINNVTNSSAIGYNTFTTLSNQVVIGNTSVVTGGIGVQNPSAMWQIKSGTAAASTAPTKLAQFAPVLNTVPERYALEVDSTSTSQNLYYTSGVTPTRYTVTKSLTSTATLDFDLTALNYQDLTVTVTGAADGDAVSIGVPNGASVADVTYYGWASATNTVTIRAARVGGGGAADPASGTFRVSVLKY